MSPFNGAIGVLADLDAPRVLEAVWCQLSITHSRLNAAVPEIRLQRAVSVPRFANTKPVACRNMGGCTLKPISAAIPARSTSFCRPLTVKGAPCSETKAKGNSAARFSARSARISSPSAGVLLRSRLWRAGWKDSASSECSAWLLLISRQSHAPSLIGDLPGKNRHYACRFSQSRNLANSPRPYGSRR